MIVFKFIVWDAKSSSDSDYSLVISSSESVSIT